MHRFRMKLDSFPSYFLCKKGIQIVTAVGSLLEYRGRGTETILCCYRRKPKPSSAITRMGRKPKLSSAVAKKCVKTQIIICYLLLLLYKGETPDNLLLLLGYKGKLGQSSAAAGILGKTQSYLLLSPDLLL
jgi:hypothetical protein